MSAHQTPERSVQEEAGVREQERIRGALNALIQLAVLERDAESSKSSKEGDTVRGWSELKAEVGRRFATGLASVFGELSPKHNGALRAIGEYIHTSLTAGQPDLARWRPEVSMTEAENEALYQQMELEQSGEAA